MFAGSMLTRSSFTYDSPLTVLNKSRYLSIWSPACAVFPIWPANIAPVTSNDEAVFLRNEVTPFEVKAAPAAPVFGFSAMVFMVVWNSVITIVIDSERVESKSVLELHLRNFRFKYLGLWDFFDSNLYDSTPYVHFGLSLSVKMRDLTSDFFLSVDFFICCSKN